MFSSNRPVKAHPVYTIRLPFSLILRLRRYATFRGLAPSSVARSFIEQVLDKHDHLSTSVGGGR